MTEPLTLACPICGARLVLTPAQREDRTFAAACRGGGVSQKRPTGLLLFAQNRNHNLWPFCDSFDYDGGKK